MAPRKVLDAIEVVLNYMWEEEAEDYSDEGAPEGHVFEHLTVIEQWLEAERVKRARKIT